MRYDGIDIYGCDRFSVSGITGFVLTPESRIQMILGKNGAGKSSLMTLGYTPFAPNEMFFKNGGHWKVKITHRGSAYQLSATYDGKVQYSFIDANGDELNKSRNVSTQNDLIKQHFNLTKDIQELIVGNVPLTKLTPQARRDWMAKLSDSDFGYAFKALNHYKKIHSYHNSVCTHLKGQINEEVQKLILEEDLAPLQARRLQLQAEYDELQEMPHYPIDRRISLHDLQASISEIVTLSDDYLFRTPTRPSYASEEAFNEAIDTHRNITQHLSGSMDLLTTDIVELQQELGRIDNLLGEDFSDLTKQYDQLVKDLAVLPVVEGIDVNYLHAAGNAIEGLRYVLTHVPTEIHDNEASRAIKLNHEAINNRLNKAQAVIDQINSNLDLIHKVEVINCPSCNHSFKPGIDPELFEKLSKRRAAGLTYLEEQTVEFEDAKLKLEEVRLVEQCKGELEVVRSQYIRQYPGLFTYLDSVDGWGVGKAMDVHLQRYVSANILHHKREHLSNQITVLKLAIDNQTACNAELPSLKKRLDEKNAQYVSFRDKADVAESTWSRLSQELTEIKEIERGCDHIHTLANKLAEDIDVFFQERHNAYRSEDLRKVTSSIAVIDSALDANGSIEDRIKEYTRQLEDNTYLAAGAKAIVDELSPKSGLIAEQIRQQIGTVLEAMNQVIRKIWGYDIRIAVGDVDEGGLDYKLPLWVGNVPRSDISEGSSSMKEIIDRAWVITAMICLGMTDYPLYQDEPAITFDDDHGLNFIPMIKELIETDKFSQLIIISHDINTQTAFPSADNLILGDMNLNHIRRYNEHVEFKY